MGIIHVQRLRQRKSNDVDEAQEPRLSKEKDAERFSDYLKLKRIWKRVEMNNPYYGFAMCTVLFRNHPQYEKFFQNEFVPEFVQEAKIKKKFTLVCDTLCSLFVDYHAKPMKRDYLTGYIAMVHKDMGLTIDDIHNFFSSLLESLVIELPDLMTDEYIDAQKRYFDQLSVQVMAFMDQHNRQMTRQLRPSVVTNRKCLWFKADPEMKQVYGYPIKYWLHKRRYWEYRRAIWESLEADMMVNSMMDTESPERDRRYKRTRRPRSRRRRSPSTTPPNRSSDTYDQITDSKLRVSFWHEGRNSSKIRQMRENFEKKLLSDDQVSTPETAGTPQEQGSQSPIGAVDSDVIPKLLMRERRVTLDLEERLEKVGEEKLEEANGKGLEEVGEVEKDSVKEVKTVRRGDMDKGTGVGVEREEMGTPRRKLGIKKERVVDKPWTVDDVNDEEGIARRLKVEMKIFKPQTVDVNDEEDIGKRLKVQMTIYKPQGVDLNEEGEIGRRVRNVGDIPWMVNANDMEEVSRRVEDEETTRRITDNSQIGTEKQVNESARARKRKQTTYPGHAQPYDRSLLDDDDDDDAQGTAHWYT